jgi:hypothetical protein
MIRVYAKENATQRGSTSTALAGAVSSALKFGLKAMLTGTSQKFLRGLSDRAIETMEGNIVAGQGIGWEAILAFFGKTPGMNSGNIQQQLAHLKACGAYARIVQDVRAEIAQEHQGISYETLPGSAVRPRHAA